MGDSVESRFESIVFDADAGWRDTLAGAVPHKDRMDTVRLLPGRVTLGTST